MFTVNHRDMVFGLEHLVEERRRSAQSALGREACAANPASRSLLDRTLANAGNWPAVQGHRLEERYGEAEKPIAMTDPHRAETC
jgi:hypothetical protein